MSTVEQHIPATGRSSRVVTFLRVVVLGWGVLGVAAGTYFTFAAAPEDGGVATAFDAFLGAWKIATSLGLVAAVTWPRVHVRSRLTAAGWLLGADVVFNLIKVFGYDEPESAPILIVSAMLFGLVWGVRVTGRGNGPK